MRLLTVAFSSAEEFLANYSDAYPAGAVFCSTRAKLSLRAAVLLEISFPGLPNRAVIRGSVASLRASHGGWVRFSEIDGATGSYVVACARGDRAAAERLERAHRRFPAKLPVTCRVDELDDPRSGTLPCWTHDLGAGGAFLVAAQAPPVGTRVSLLIGADPRAQLLLGGRVAWIRQDGFGVRFDLRGDRDAARLRMLLRRSAETGRLQLPQS